MPAFDMDDLRRRMDGALHVLKKEYAGLRTGRASVSLLEPVTVAAYDSEMPLSQLATISAPEPRLLSVQVWDRSLAKAVETAIRASGLGLNPIGEGQLIRVPIPELTEERRKELAKIAHKYAEEARVAVRNVRRDGMDSLKALEKSGDISQDEHHERGVEVQELTDAMIAEIGQVMEEKEKEILQV
ncbi:MAG TPA: ribosome recycling factor [Alphaproteobacteria bacterium]